jgi:CheY-like chemotaxis protein
MNELKNSDIKVLFVDDKDDALELAIDYLEEIYEYQVDTETSAEKAIIKLKNGSFHVVVTDMRMEKDDSGFDVLDAVNRNQLSTFVIIITANDSLEGCRKAWQKGAWDYISKNSQEYNPFDEVHNSIKKLIFHLHKRKGHQDDIDWIEENRQELLKKYQNRYIAVLHREVIADANSKSELIDTLLERKISPYLAYIEFLRLELDDKKPTIFVEGPTDILYLKKAIDIFNKDNLKENIKIDVVGNQIGTKNNGEKSMKNAFNFLKENPEIRGKSKILFLFDNDIKSTNLPNNGKPYENIYIERTGEYRDNHYGISGIESFFSLELYEEGFKRGFIQKTIRQNYNSNERKDEIKYKIKNKKEFCKWVLENRADKETFNNFKSVIDILENFLYSKAEE